MKQSFLGQRSISALLTLLLVLNSTGAFAQKSAKQQPKDDATAQSGQSSDQNDPNYDPRKDPNRQKGKGQEKGYHTEMSKEMKKWLDEDVRWIITDEEKDAFKKLSNDEEREQFIEQFWLRRDPTPDTVENEFKEEHYRRIAYANEHFAAGIPGWRTDRGQMYIKFGPPDTIDSHPSGGTYQRPMEEGGGTTSTFPFEVWRYRYLEGQNLGNEVEIEFVDTCNCGEYHMTLDRTEKDALKYTPNGGLTLYEQMGMASKADRFGGGLEAIGPGPMSNTLQSKQFDRLAQFAALQRAPSIKMKDFEELVTHKIRYNLLPFDARFDFVKLTDTSVLVPLTLQVKNKDLNFEEKDGVARAAMNIAGRVTTMTGRVAQTFEDTVTTEVPSELLPKTLENANVYWKGMQLKPGAYKIQVVIKDIKGDRVGQLEKGIRVPDMSEDRGLASSTLILADQMEKVPTKVVGSGNFVIGTTKVRPRVESQDKPAAFKRNQKLNFWLQVYNLGIDEQSKKASASIEYDIVNASTKQPVFTTTETTDQLGNSGDQITLEKTLALASLNPGTYELTIKVNDKIAKQTISPTAKFVVE